MDDATRWTSRPCPAARSPQNPNSPCSTRAPQQEADRLRALFRYGALDAARSEAFDAITREAAALFEVPVALISLVDEDRIWFLSRYGLKFDEVARDPGLCATLIVSDAPYILTDAAVDPRARNHPLVTGRFRLRFYAGEPLVTPAGYAIGAISIIDRVPRQPRPGSLDPLRQFASATMDRLEAHRLSLWPALQSQEPTPSPASSLSHHRTMAVERLSDRPSATGDADVAS